MTQEEILEYNKRCAEFLGGVYDSDMTRYWFYLPVKWDGVFAPTTGELRFHSDWNWIMEVIEAIEKLGAEYYLSNKSFAISYTLSEGNLYAEDTVVKTDRPTKEAVVQAINQFLIWYEQNK